MSDYLDAVLQQSSINSAFAADQAQLNRDWQEAMSNTAHQREVNDLIAAGLNPVLSANSGASWQAVGNATPDTSSAQALGNLAATVLNNQASIEMSKIAAGAQVAAASSAASIAAQATRDAANISADAARDTSQVNFSGGSPHVFTISGSMPAYMVKDYTDAANSAYQAYAHTYSGY